MPKKTIFLWGVSLAVIAASVFFSLNYFQPREAEEIKVKNYVKNGDFGEKTLGQYLLPTSIFIPKDWKIYKKDSLASSPQFKVIKEKPYTYVKDSSLKVEAKDAGVGLSQKLPQKLKTPFFVQANVLVRKGRVKLALVDGNNQEVDSVEGGIEENEWQRLPIRISENSQLVEKIVVYSTVSDSEWYITNVNVKEPKDYGQIYKGLGEFSIKEKLESCENLREGNYIKCVTDKTGLSQERWQEFGRSRFYYEGEEIKETNINIDNSVLGDSNAIEVSYVFFDINFSEEEKNKLVKIASSAWDDEDVEKKLDFSGATKYYFDPTIPSKCNTQSWDGKNYYFPDIVCSTVNWKVKYIFASFDVGMCQYAIGSVFAGMNNREDIAGFTYTIKHETGHLFGSPDTDFVAINGNYLFPEGNSKEQTKYADVMYSRVLNAEEYVEGIINRIIGRMGGAGSYSTIEWAKIWNYQVMNFRLTNENTGSSILSGRYKIFLAKEGPNHIKGVIDNSPSFGYVSYSGDLFFNGTISLPRYPFKAPLFLLPGETAAFVIIKLEDGEIFTGKFDLIDVSVANFKGDDYLTIKMSKPNFYIDFDNLIKISEIPGEAVISNTLYFFDNYISTGKFRARLKFIDSNNNREYFDNFFSIKGREGVFSHKFKINIPYSAYNILIELFNGEQFVGSIRNQKIFQVNENTKKLDVSFNLMPTELLGKMTLLRDGNFDYNRAQVVLERKIPQEGKRKHYYSNSGNKYVLENQESLVLDYKVRADSGVYNVYVDFTDEEGKILGPYYYPEQVSLGENEVKAYDLYVDLRAMTLITTPSLTLTPTQTLTLVPTPSFSVCSPNKCKLYCSLTEKELGQLDCPFDQTCCKKVATVYGEVHVLTDGDLEIEKVDAQIARPDFIYDSGNFYLPTPPDLKDFTLKYYIPRAGYGEITPGDYTIAFVIFPKGRKETVFIPESKVKVLDKEDVRFDYTLDMRKTAPSLVPFSTLTPTPRPTLRPTNTPTPTSTPTPTPLPQFGKCGSCSSDSWGGCTPGNECRLINDYDLCVVKNKKGGVPCCLRDISCSPSYKQTCGASTNDVYCHKCSRFQNYSPFCTNFDLTCGGGKPAKPRIKSPTNNLSFNAGSSVNLSWYAFGEGLKSGCAEKLESDWPSWQDCNGQTYYGKPAQCVLETDSNATDRSCWGYTCAKGSFGIPADWRFYTVFAKHSSETNYHQVCHLTNIPNTSTSLGWGGSLPNDKSSCNFIPDKQGSYQWYVRAGYSVNTAGGVSVMGSDSEISSFTISASAVTLTPVPTISPTVAPTSTPILALTPTPAYTRECRFCKVYDEGWRELPLLKFKLNQKVYLATKGETNASTVNSKARFRINSSAEASWCSGNGLTVVNNWCETTLKHGWDEFYVPYTFTQLGKITIESMVYNQAIGWY